MSNRKKFDTDKKKSGSSAKKILITVLIIAVSLLCIFASLFNTGYLHRMLRAVTVNGERVSAQEYKIYYMDQYSQYQYTLAMYGMLSDNFLNEPSWFGEEDEEITWGEFFRKQAIETLTEVKVLNAEAAASGTDYTQQAKDSTDYYFADLQNNIASTGHSIETYLVAFYGTGTSVADVRKVQTEKATAQLYMDDVKSTYDITDEEIQAYYDENKATYDVASYMQYTFPYQTYTYTAPAEGTEPAEGAPTSEEEAAEWTETSKDEAMAYAKELLDGVGSYLDFDIKAAELYKKIGEANLAEGEELEDYVSSLHENASISGTSAIFTWLQDDSRKEGDTEIVDTGSGYAVMLFIDRHLKEVPTAAVRHILFSKIEATEDMTAAQIEKVNNTNAEALATAETVLQQWKDGEATEESFAALAKEYSLDYGSKLTGGLYAEAYQGQMVPEFDAWLFDESRRYGDTDIVETDYGYHIMFYVGMNDKYFYEYEIRDILRNERYNEQMDAKVESAEVTRSSAGLSIVE